MFSDLTSNIDGLTPVNLIKDSHKTVYFCNFNGKSAYAKYANEEPHITAIEREFRSTKIICESTDIDTSEPLLYLKNGEEIIAIFGSVETTIPSKDEWSNFEYGKELVDSAAHVLNELHYNDKIKKTAKTRLSNNGFPIEYRYDTLRSSISDMVHQHEESPYLETALEVLDFLHNTRPEANTLSHTDFLTANYGLSNGVEPIIDWEGLGFFDPVCDIGAFEASVVDEFFETQLTEEESKALRNQFHEQLQYDFDEERLLAYRYIYTAMTYACVVDGKCSQLWLNVGDVETIEKHKKESLEQMKVSIEELIDTY